MKDVVIVCIGSDKISGDALGPLVGSRLKEHYKMPFPVYGAVGESVNGLNLDEYRKMLCRHHRGSAVIAVDAAVGKGDEVGRIRLKKGGLRAGGAMGKGQKVGDIGIVGVVAEETVPEDVYTSLMAVPFAFVEEMSFAISDMIAVALTRNS